MISTVLVWLLVDWRPRRVFSIESAFCSSLGAFSARIFSASVLTWGNQNLDKALVGRFLGGGPLGAYFARVHRDAGARTAPQSTSLSGGCACVRENPIGQRAARASLVGSKQLSVAVVAPALLALIVVAPDLVRVVFGDQWDAAIAPLQLL